jgi:hypothetical protein
VFYEIHQQKLIIAGSLELAQIFVDVLPGSDFLPITQRDCKEKPARAPQGHSHRLSVFPGTIDAPA